MYIWRKCRASGRVGSGQTFCLYSRVGSGRVNVSPGRVWSGPRKVTHGREIAASLKFEGKVAWVKDRFARCEMRMEKVSAHLFIYFIISLKNIQYIITIIAIVD